jgi:hypothetical protein
VLEFLEDVILKIEKSFDMYLEK